LHPRQGFLMLYFGESRKQKADMKAGLRSFSGAEGRKKEEYSQLAHQRYWQGNQGDRIYGKR